METRLSRTELFRDFPEDVIREDILPYGQLQEFRKDQTIIEPQQTVNTISILLSGRVHITHIFPDGAYSLMTALNPPEILGFDLICTRSRIAPYYAAAIMPTQLLSFPADLLLNPGMLREEYRLICLRNLLTMISHHNMKKEYRLAILSQKGLRSRIMTYLSMQANKRQTNSFRIPFTREEMAAFLCVNRSALSHELSLMEQEGLLSFRGSRFTLHESDKWKIQNSYEI